MYLLPRSVEEKKAYQMRKARSPDIKTNNTHRLFWSSVPSPGWYSVIDDSSSPSLPILNR